MIEGLRLTFKYASCCEKMKRSFGIPDLTRNNVGKLKKIFESLDFFKYYKKIARLNNIDDLLNIRIASYYWTGYPKLNGDLYHNWTTLIPILKMPIKKIDVKMVDDCFVQAGIIMSVKGNSINVKYRPIIKSHKRLVLGKQKEKVINKGFLVKRRVQPYNWITFHFGTAIEIINTEKYLELLKISESVLDKLNKNRATI